MDNALDNTLKRINVKIPAYIQDYYKALGEKYGMPYSNYMAMVLVNYFEKEKEKKVVEDLNNNLNVMRTMSGNINVDEINKQNQMILEQLLKLQANENNDK